MRLQVLHPSRFKAEIRVFRRMGSENMQSRCSVYAVRPGEEKLLKFVKKRYGMQSQGHVTSLTLLREEQTNDNPATSKRLSGLFRQIYFTK